MLPTHSCSLVQNWEDMERVWSYLFTDKMGLHPPPSKPGTSTGTGVSDMRDKKILITEAPMNPRENRCVHALHVESDHEMTIVRTCSIANMRACKDSLSLPRIVLQAPHGGNHV